MMKKNISSSRKGRNRRPSADAIRRREGAARRLAEENAVMAEIGRIISSTLNIEEAYQLFSRKVK